MTSWGDNPIMKSFDINYQDLDATGFYSFPYVDVGKFTNFTVNVWNDNSNLTMDIYRSVNGADASRDAYSQQVVIPNYTFMQPIGTYPLNTRFVSLAFTGTIGKKFSCQCRFREAPTHLTNVGGHSEVFVTDSSGELRTIQSSVTQNSDNLDIVSAGGSSIWQETANVISPITASTHGLLSGNLNTIVQTEGMTNCAIVGGLSNTMDQIYSTNSLHFLVNDVIVGGESNSMVGKSTTNCVIVGGDTNDITGLTNTWGVNDSVILGGANNTITSDANNADRSVIIGGQANTITQSSDCVILGGNTHTINTNENKSIIGGGSQITLSRSGVFAFTGGGGGAPLSPANDNSFTMRYAGGIRFYTQAGLGSGMTMDAGLSAWSPVSDVNMKNIHCEVDYSSYLDRMRTIQIFEYNYKSCCLSNRNIGPIAQQWHEKSNFRTPDHITAKEEKNAEGNMVEVLDEEGKPVMENRGPFKDPLRICQGDQHGVALACIRALIIEIDKLKSRVVDLETRL